MRHKSPGRHKSIDSFRSHLRALAPELDCDLELEGRAGPLGQPFSIGERVIGNRFCIHPMEGWDGTRAGLPSAHTLRRWRHFGASGAKLIWGGEAFAVQEDGRANPNQLFLNPRAEVAAGLSQLFAAVRDAHVEAGDSTDDLYLGLQLTHSGRFSRPDGLAQPLIAYHHPVLDAKFGIDASAAIASDAQLEAIAENFVQAAKLAWRTGFDFVDVKCCHGYLLHELLGARARPGAYGGSFENRTRLFRSIVAAVRSECPGLDVVVRLSLADLFPYSPGADRVGEPSGWEENLPFEHQFGVDRDDPRRFDLDEPLRFLGLLEQLGVRLVNVTLGSPYYCPHLQRPAAYPPSDGYLPPEDPLHGVAQHILGVRRAKQAFPGLALVGTGYSYLQEYLPHVAQYELREGHVDFVGLGRMLLSYPDLPRDVLAGRALDRKRICRTFSDCTTGPRNGLVSGCYPLDPYYKALPEAERLKAIKKELG